MKQALSRRQKDGNSLRYKEPKSFLTPFILKKIALQEHRKTVIMRECFMILVFIKFQMPIKYLWFKRFLGLKAIVRRNDTKSWRNGIGMFNSPTLMILLKRLIVENIVIKNG